MFAAAVEGYVEPFEHPANWSPEFADFLSHCLLIDPKPRWTVDQLLGHPFLQQAVTPDHMRELVSRLAAQDFQPQNMEMSF